MRASVAAVALIGLMAAGCSTPAELATTAPVRSQMVASGVDDLSACVLRDLTALMAASGVSLRRRIDGKTATIDGGLSSPDWTTFQLHFAPAGARQTMVTMRSVRTVWGDPTFVDDVWPVVRQCDAPLSANH